MRQYRKVQGACHGAGLASVCFGIRHAKQFRRRMQVTCSNNSSSGTGVLVDGLVVQPAYRSTPWDAEHQRSLKGTDKALIMFVSESGICRGPLAAALLNNMLDNSPLREWIEVQTRASRDYCLGQAPHPTAAAVAAALGTPLPAAAAAAGTSDGDPSSSSGGGGGSSGGGGAAAVQFDPAADIVAADLVLVMDKYTAADVLREVSSYDLINPGGHYSARVRLLGSFHPQLSQTTSQADGQDIDDPLYGNIGGEQEQVDVLLAAKLIYESCCALLEQLEALATEHGLIPGGAGSNGVQTEGQSNSQTDMLETRDFSSSSSNSSSSNGASERSPGAQFREVLVGRIREEGVISWLVPPMLQGSNTDLGGWV